MGFKAFIIGLVAIFSSTTFADYTNKTDLARQLKKANTGDAAAQFSLSIMYEQGGYGFSDNQTEAKKWIYKSAENNYVPAQLSLVDKALYNGNTQETIYWLNRAVQNNSLQAMRDLAMLNCHGILTPTNISECLNLLNRASSFQPKEELETGEYWGKIHSGIILSGMYVRGIGVKKDAAKASSLLVDMMSFVAKDSGPYGNKYSNIQTAILSIGDNYQSEPDHNPIYPHDIQQARFWYTYGIKLGELAEVQWDNNVFYDRLSQLK